MVFFNHFYYSCLLLICCMKYLNAYPCYHCDAMVFNYSVTVDTLPSPTRPDCKIKASDPGCFVGVAWYGDGTSKVAYRAGDFYLTEIVSTEIYRSVNTSDLYISRTDVVYSCVSSNTSTTPCNTPDKLKRSIMATSLPTNEQMKQFDTWIAPTLEFNSSSCFYYSNSTRYCLKPDPTRCQQCMISVYDPPQTDICATCLLSKSDFNSIRLTTEFDLINRTESHSVVIFCQTENGCNTIENSEQVRQKFATPFDFNKFFSSTASTSKLPVIILLSTLVISLFHQI